MLRPIISTDRTRLPWQPLTLGGVAAFARAPFGRLFVVASAVALLAAAAVAFFFLHAWEPALAHAVAQLPEQSEIRGGRLDWRGPSPARLVSSAFLSIVVNTGAGETLGEVADLQCEFKPTGLRLRSLLGYLDLRYPEGWKIAFNRAELDPWWGAWLPAIIAAMVAATVAGLWTIWSILAALYAVPASIVAFYSDRDATFGSHWKLAVASSLPGALLMSLAIVAYGFYQINLVQFLGLFALHFAVAWVYVLLAPLRLPRLAAPERVFGEKNPFREPSAR